MQLSRVAIGLALALAVVACKKDKEKPAAPPAGPITAEQLAADTTRYEDIANRLCAAGSDTHAGSDDQDGDEKPEAK